MFIPFERDEVLRNEPRLKSGLSDDPPSPRLRRDKRMRITPQMDAFRQPPRTMRRFVS
jgi:hypothetical protein